MPNYLINKPRWESEADPPPEVRELMNALSVYAVGLDNADSTDFTPTEVLYSKYLTDHQYLDKNVQGKVMSREEFGAVFRRVFDLADQGIKAGQVWVGDRRVRGYRYCKGPGSLKVRREPGHPQSVAVWNLKKRELYRQKYGVADDAQAPAAPAVTPASTHDNPIYRDIV